MPSRRTLMLLFVLGLPVVAWLGWRDTRLRRPPKTTADVPMIVKLPVNFASRTFDPEQPPSDMPPLNPGENAECDSNFLSSASVRGDTRPLDATHATVTISQITVTLQLDITIWVPAGVTPHVIEHEEGHRQISEYYYRSADALAGQIAAPYIGRQVEIAGSDLDAESNKALQQAADEITAEYTRELNTEPAQLLYDSITDHSRNQVVAMDAVNHALKNVSIESSQPPGSQQ